MSKIDELEQKIIKQGMTDEDFAEYQKILKRVIFDDKHKFLAKPKDSRFYIKQIKRTKLC